MHTHPEDPRRPDAESTIVAAPTTISGSPLCPRTRVERTEHVPCRGADHAATLVRLQAADDAVTVLHDAVRMQLGADVVVHIELAALSGEDQHCRCMDVLRGHGKTITSCASHTRRAPTRVGRSVEAFAPPIKYGRSDGAHRRPSTKRRRAVVASARRAASPLHVTRGDTGWAQSVSLPVLLTGALSHRVTVVARRQTRRGIARLEWINMAPQTFGGTPATDRAVARWCPLVLVLACADCYRWVPVTTVPEPGKRTVLLISDDGKRHVATDVTSTDTQWVGDSLHDPIRSAIEVVFRAPIARWMSTRCGFGFGVLTGGTGIVTAAIVLRLSACHPAAIAATAIGLAAVMRAVAH